MALKLPGEGSQGEGPARFSFLDTHAKPCGTYGLAQPSPDCFQALPVVLHGGRKMAQLSSTGMPATELR